MTENRGNHENRENRENPAIAGAARARGGYERSANPWFSPLSPRWAAPLPT